MVVARRFSMLVVVWLTAAASLPPGGTFVDDDGNVHEPDIEAVAAAGITRGCNPPFGDRFCPDDLVTRGQMAAFLVRALAFPAGEPDAFLDDDGSIFEDDIDRLAAAGVTRGCDPPTNQRFCPDDPVTRGQMAAFLVRAFGYHDSGAGDFFVDDEGQVFEGDIDRLRAAGVTKGCNPPTNDRFCPTTPVSRAEMASFLTRALDLVPIDPPAPVSPMLELVVGGLSSPVHAVAVPGGDELLVAELGGRLRLVDGGAISGTFLDLRSAVVTGGERGLLSLALHPDYAANGRIFVLHSGSVVGSGNHSVYLVEYLRDADPTAADPDSRRVLLTVDQPFSNHNGGHLAFGPDGMLYVSLGDGGSGNDPLNVARDPDELLGKLLRIDVDGAEPYAIPPDNPFVDGPGRDEIWAIGLRNPWRFSFDGDRLFIGDVGQSQFEEVDLADAGAAGLDYGWRTFEGTDCTGNDAGCDRSGVTFPVHQYGHDEGCSISGGVVVRDDALPVLQNHYLYADYCSGWIRSFRVDEEGTAVEFRDWTAELGRLDRPVSFGFDAAGQVLVVALGGDVWRITGG